MTQFNRWLLRFLLLLLLAPTPDCRMYATAAESRKTLRSEIRQLRRIEVLQRAPAWPVGRWRPLANRRRLAVVGARRRSTAAARRHLVEEYPSELLADETVDGEVDGRVKGQQSVAGDVAVAEGL